MHNPIGNVSNANKNSRHLKYREFFIIEKKLFGLFSFCLFSCILLSFRSLCNRCFCNRSVSFLCSLNGQNINYFGTSFGLSLPVKGFSNITLVGEYGKRGTTTANLIKENEFNLRIGFTLNDKWFQRTKYQ